MKNNEEFLSDMWAKIFDYDTELVRLETIKKENKNIFIKEVINYLVIGSIFLVSIISIINSLEFTYMVSILIIIVAFIADKKSYVK